MTTTAYLAKICKDDIANLPKLTAYQKDLAVACSCGARIGKPCKNKFDGNRKNTVHFARRLKRLLMGLR